MLLEQRRFICPACNSSNVKPDPGYQTVFRCRGCSYIGNENDFIEVRES